MIKIAFAASLLIIYTRTELNVVCTPRNRPSLALCHVDAFVDLHGDNVTCLKRYEHAQECIVDIWEF